MTKLYTYLPNVEQLKRELENKGIEEFVKGYSSYESIEGSPESVDFVENISEELKKRKVTQVGEGGSLLNC